jgi:hypothetical protein
MWFYFLMVGLLLRTAWLCSCGLTKTYEAVITPVTSVFSSMATAGSMAFCFQQLRGWLDLTGGAPPTAAATPLSMTEQAWSVFGAGAKHQPTDYVNIMLRVLRFAVG